MLLFCFLEGLHKSSCMDILMGDSEIKKGWREFLFVIKESETGWSPALWQALEASVIISAVGKLHLEWPLLIMKVTRGNLCCYWLFLCIRRGGGLGLGAFHLLLYSESPEDFYSWEHVCWRHRNLCVHTSHHTLCEFQFLYMKMEILTTFFCRVVNED